MKNKKLFNKPKKWNRVTGINRMLYYDYFFHKKYFF